MANLAPKAHSRWRVAIVDDHERSRAAVRAAVWAAGGEVAGEARALRGCHPDGHARAPRRRHRRGRLARRRRRGDRRRDHPERRVSGGAAHQPYRDDLVARVQAAGVMAYLLKPLRPAELAPTLDLAIARSDEAQPTPADARGAQGHRARQGAPDGASQPHRGRGVPPSPPRGDEQPPPHGRPRAGAARIRVNRRGTADDLGSWGRCSSHGFQGFPTLRLRYAPC